MPLHSAAKRRHKSACFPMLLDSDTALPPNRRERLHLSVVRGPMAVPMICSVCEQVRCLASDTFGYTSGHGLVAARGFNFSYAQACAGRICNTGYTVPLAIEFTAKDWQDQLSGL